jgi:MerR family transcriptional regulator, thiopeptide resistance regulator
MSYTVGQLAALAGVTVRTLHHYDRIGLLVPEGRAGSAGYRRYGPESVERLHRILTYRELGLDLDEIATLLDDPDVDRLAHLRRQELLLRERIARLEEMVAAVQLMMEAEHMAVKLTPEERFELFGQFDVDAHTAEAEERWGDTDAFKESQRRVARYGADEWRRIKAEAEAIEAGFAAALSGCESADGAWAMALAERHRAHISRWFYECPIEIHRGLGELYVADPRFTEHYDRIAEGLARFVRDAIAANAERAQAAAEG